MKKKKIYIIYGVSRASSYGVGTYVEQLTACLKQANMDFEFVLLFSEGKEVSIIEKNGYKEISIPSPPDVYSGKRFFCYSEITTYLLRELIPEDSDTEYIFHVNQMTNPYLISGLKKLFRCKIILVAHYTNWSFSLLGDYKRLKSIMSTSLTKLNPEEKQIVKDIKLDIKMIGRCDQLVCVAQHTLDSFKGIYNIKEERCVVINNALKDVYIEKSEGVKQLIRQNYHIAPNSRIVLFAGRLDEVKGILFLIRAFKKVLDRHPDSMLLIAGDGNFKQWISEASFHCTKIIFTGKLEKKRLYDLYQIADVGVVPSIHEEFGYTAIEMMMHRLPVVACDVGGLAEIIEDNVSGLKVRVRTIGGERAVDVNMMSGKINQLLEDPQLANTVGINGRKRFLEKYELSGFKKSMLDLYLNI